MNTEIRAALDRDKVIDITTTGRKTGQPRRKEMWFHNVDGDIYITGSPGTRDWYANVVAHPDFTFHLKVTTRADLQARATPIVDDATRKVIMGKILQKLDRSEQLSAWLAGSPLIAVELHQE